MFSLCVCVVLSGSCPLRHGSAQLRRLSALQREEEEAESRISTAAASITHHPCVNTQLPAFPLRSGWIKLWRVLQLREVEQSRWSHCSRKVRSRGLSQRRRGGAGTRPSTGTPPGRCSGAQQRSQLSAR